jgi:hypothetical protein
MAETRSPEREELARAIAAHTAAKERLERTRTAASTASDMGFRARRREEFLEQQLSELRGSQGQWLASALLTGDPPATSPLKEAEAEAELADAVTARKEARAAEEALGKQIEQEQKTLEYSGRDVKRAAAKVLGASPLAIQALEDLEAAQRAVCVAGDKLRFLINHQALAVPSVAPGGAMPSDLDPFLKRCRRANGLLDIPPTGWNSLLREAQESPGSSKDLDRLLKALESDPEAALPG